MQSDWSQDTLITNDDIHLFYTRTGKGEKPSLVLAHGLTDCGLCWHQLASDLETDFDVIMYDAYGHGKSSRVDPEKPFDLVKDLYNLITSLELKKPGVIGHSMGAATAAEFAAAYPDLLSALVLEDPPWSDQEYDEKQLRTTMQEWKKSNLSAKEKSVKELIKRKKKESPNWEEEILEAWAQAKLDIDPSFYDYFQRKHTKWQDVAAKITVPMLLVAGDPERGAIITPHLGVEAVKIIKKGEFGHISGAGHCVRYEQYQPYLTLVRLFLNRTLK